MLAQEALMKRDQPLFRVFLAGVVLIVLGMVLGVLHYFQILENSHRTVAIDVALPIFLGVLLIAWRIGYLQPEEPKVERVAEPNAKTSST